MEFWGELIMYKYLIEITAYHDGIFIVLSANSKNEAYQKAVEWAATTDDFENYRDPHYVKLLEESPTFVFPDSLSYRITELSHLGKDNNIDVVARWDE